MEGLAKLLIIGGLFLLLMGAFVLLFSKLGGGFRLPGDIYFQRGNFSFYFPIATSIIISLVLTILLNLFLRR